MIFGLRTGLPQTATARRSGLFTATGAAALLALSMLSGCSGGSSSGGSNNNNNGGGGQASGETATLNGTVVDKENGLSPDPDAVVAFNKYYAVTGSDGSFSLHIPSGTTGTLIVYGKVVRDANKNVVLGSNGLPESDNTYINTGYYPASSSTQVPLLSVGIPISAQASGSTNGLGAIGLLTTNDPPPPPQFPN